MSNNKSFFKRITDSFASLLPKHDENGQSSIQTDRNSMGSRRLLPSTFDSIDETVTKKPKLHHDLFSLPVSRLVKSNDFTNNFNDTGSELSDHSNTSISTSGVSSLNPKQRKLGNNSSNYLKTTFSQNSFDTRPSYSNSYMSSSAKKILEKLGKLSTPITNADKLKHQIKFQKIKTSKPYDRPVPTIDARKKAPLKAVTVSGSSNMNYDNTYLQRRNKKFGFSDDIDLDDENNVKLETNNKINFSHIPLIQKSVSTNTDESYASCVYKIKSEDLLTFDFSLPKNIDESSDSDKVSDFSDESTTISRSPKYELKTIVENKLSEMPKIELKKKGWRCETCFGENEIDSNSCVYCDSIERKARDKKLNKYIIKEPNINNKSLNEDENKSKSNHEIISTSVCSNLPTSSTYCAISFNTTTSEPHLQSTSTPFIFGSNLTEVSSIDSQVSKCIDKPIISMPVFQFKNSNPIAENSTSQLPVFSSSNNVKPIVSLPTFQFNNPVNNIETSSVSIPKFQFSSNETKEKINTSLPQFSLATTTTTGISENKGFSFTNSKLFGNNESEFNKNTDNSVFTLPKTDSNLNVSLPEVKSPPGFSFKSTGNNLSVSENKMGDTSKPFLFGSSNISTGLFSNQLDDNKKKKPSTDTVSTFQFTPTNTTSNIFSFGQSAPLTSQVNSSFNFGATENAGFGTNSSTSSTPYKFSSSASNTGENPGQRRVLKSKRRQQKQS